MSSTHDTALLRLNDTNGSTVQLQLSNGKSTFSLGSNVWLPVAGIKVSGGTTGLYTFVGGLVERDGVVAVNPITIIEAINAHAGTDKISFRLLDVPECASYVAGDGIEISGNTISATAVVADVWEDLRR